MKTNRLFKTSSVLIISGALLAASCNKEEQLNQQDTQDISEETLVDTYFQDIDDMAAVAIQAPTDVEFGGGRRATTITIEDERFKCEGIIVTLEALPGSDFLNPKGLITVDFGSEGCEVNNIRRSGKVFFTYDGRRFVPGSTVVVTVENYVVNGVRLEGTRTITNETLSIASAPSFRAELENGKITFEDGTIATRESNILYTWVREASPANDKLVVDQSSAASGTTRAGRTYTVSLLEALEFKRFCGFAVSGVKKFVIEGKEITIDYGDGDCDRSVTVTINGLTRTVNVNS